MNDILVSWGMLGPQVSPSSHHEVLPRFFLSSLRVSRDFFLLTLRTKLPSSFAAPENTHPNWCQLTCGFTWHDSRSLVLLRKSKNSTHIWGSRLPMESGFLRILIFVWRVTMIGSPAPTAPKRRCFSSLEP